MNKMYLVLGDWSDDGHGKYEKVLLKSNVDVAVIQQAYKDSCKLTGISFNINEDYTGRNRNWEQRDEYQIATTHCGSVIPNKALIELMKFGFKENFLDNDKYDFSELPEVLASGEDLNYDDLFTEIWIWFVKLSLPENTILEKADVKDKIPVINGYWNKNLNVQFGYGLYS
jgi:hypothetical protein